ncbi:RlpA-like double-psi beta-barrel-protein domain-containing protein-containing protein [Kockovaella imperatae]|uniref:RlpA-like double-psi beta-barrel-protein domain-containing protein-containing protein n=1 Tax=Kockovaella imperatae TaxID=4999 RepID=A0A1Y1UEM7_9TREE|nr:RlpA-like double-psi beta-barrel-protein domain-containing protein-containing protein [Kockovaella imperatae]ORX36521.1 RlpA-like double-psi beta-barrel-protein domain-containing protein-containing protein [Kockovaella imperatae]
MFASSVLFAALASMAIAAPVDMAVRDDKAPPPGWAYGYLENYTTYHTRYLALDCQDKHNTEFFEQCCHPLLATQTLKADRPSQCWPTNAELASATAEENSTAGASANAAAASDFSAATSTVSAALASMTQEAAANPSPSPAAQPSTTEQQAAASSPSPSPASNNNGGGGNWNTGGQATFFYQNGNPGACGNYHDDSYPLVAIDQAWWPGWQSGNSSPYCGQWVNIVNTDTGASVTAQVQDVCPTCANGNSLDLSVGAFTAIGSESQGVLPIKWEFV